MVLPTIPEFFRSRCVLVTGGTGFMGKVLLSKLLRSCPHIQTIYVLIRSSRGKSADSRLKDILALPVFDKAENVDKLVAVEGDVTALHLGLNDADYQKLTENVSIVFHVAASVRFNDLLNEAILMNTRGTQEIVNLCLQMKQLVAFLHVSTTYSNCDRKVVEEQVYPCSVDWRDAIKIAEELDPATLNTFCSKFIGNKPNTYTFTKCLAEQVVWSHRHVLPVVIFRPSIVISTWKDPMPGWLDNLNGPVGMMMGAGTGVLRVSMCDKDIVPDFMAVDVAIQAMIIATYHKAISGVQEAEEHVINCASASSSISNKKLIDLGLSMVNDVPLSEALWAPSDDTTTSKTYFTIKSWFAHLLPAIFVDLILRIAGMEPRLLKIQKKIFIAISALSFFTCQEWKFKNEKFLRLLQYVLPEDKEDFDFDFRSIDPKTYFRQCILGARIYLLNDPLENIPAGKRRNERLYWINKIFTVSFYLFLVWILDLPRRMMSLLSLLSFP